MEFSDKARKKNFRKFLPFLFYSTGMKKIFRAKPISWSHSLFIQLQFAFCGGQIRPFVFEISNFECKRILFHSTADISETTGHPASGQRISYSVENYLQKSVMVDSKKNFFPPVTLTWKKSKKMPISLFLVNWLYLWQYWQKILG